jgi:hypothetical protein
MITWYQFLWQSEEETNNNREDQALKIFWKQWNPREMGSFGVKSRLGKINK